MEPVTNAGGSEIRSELERILHSRTFEKAKRSQRFLRYLVEAALCVPRVAVKEYTLAVEVFDRDPNYDPDVDATVRVEAGRLRSRLRDYYLAEGQNANVVIDIPKGSYAATFSFQLSRVAGGRSTGEVQTPADNLNPQQPEVPEPLTELASDGTKSDIRQPLLRAGLLAVLVLLLTLGTILSTFHEKGMRAAPNVHSMAVLPLRNLSGSPDQNYLTEGMTDQLNTELARIPHFRVISHESVMQEELQGKPLKQIGKELDVDTIVEGSVLRNGDVVRINVQVTDVRNDRQLWAASVQGTVKDLITLEDNVAEEIVSHARLDLLPGSQFQRTVGEHPSPDAYDAYLRGRYFLDKRDGIQSVAYFRRAIALEPTFASAYAGLAEALDAGSVMGSLRPAEAINEGLAAAHKAIELDPQNGPAYSALGTIEFTDTWDWDRASQDLLRGIQLSPGDSFPVTMYGLFLETANRPGDAVAQMRKAAVMDPLSFFVSRSLGAALYFDRQYDEAIKQLNRTKELFPEMSGIDNWMSWTYEAKDMRDEAIRYELASLRVDLANPEFTKLQQSYQTGGWQAYWKARLSTTLHHPVQPCIAFDKGMSYLRLGDLDHAVGQFQISADQRCFWMGLIEIDPRFDGLRNDPRYPELVRRIHPASPIASR